MARSKEYWYDLMIAEKNSMSNLSGLQPSIDSSQTLLSDLTSNSKLAGWRLFFWCVACCAWALDTVFDLFKITLEAIASKAKVGQTPWYQIVARAFQYGDTLGWNGTEWAYPVIDESKQIIKRVSAKDVPNKVVIRVAKVVGGVNTALTLAEFSAFELYMQKVRIAGTELEIISKAADDVRLYVTINYDPLVLTSTGEMISSPGVFPAEEAINLYLKDLNDDEEFKGILELQTVVDYLQSEKGRGIVSAYVTNATARYGVAPFVAFTERYEANAGHVVVDASTPLSSTLTYVAASV